MASIRAAVMTAPLAPIEVREFPEPDLAPGSALLSTTFSEVCGTDVHLWHGRLAGVPYPIIPGHVSVGRIAKSRGPIEGIDGSRLLEGDRVVFFDVHRTCGRCRACTVARTPTKCPSRRVYGITDPASEGLLGGWSEAIYLEPGVAMAKLPDAVTDEAYIGGGCGLLTAVHAVERAGVALGSTVVVQGTGAVGLSIITLSRLAGASLVVAIGAPEDRLTLASQMGADVTLDLASTNAGDRATRIRRLTDGTGPDIVIEAAGSSSAFEEGLDLVRDGGTYVVAGHYTDGGDSRVNAHWHINRKHLDLRGCWGSEARHFLKAIGILERHGARFPWASIGARTYSLDELTLALTDAEAMRLPKALVRPRS